MTDIERNVLSELKRKLREIRNNRDFIMGVVYNAGSVENWQQVIDFIDKSSPDVEETLSFAVLLDDMTEKPLPPDKEWLIKQTKEQERSMNEQRS